MENHPIQLAFLGDLCPSGVYSRDPAQLTRSLVELRHALGREAVLFFNLECSFVEDGVGTDTQANAAALRALAALRPAVANLSNNHHFDTGLVGSQRIRAILGEIGIPTTGLYGSNRRAFDLLTIGSAQVACVCRTARGTHPGSFGPVTERILPIDHDEIVSTCRELVGRYDVCIACLHWGAEYYLRPSPRQRRLVDALVSLGVDVVWGQHAHVLQERYLEARSLVMFNMGNAIFGELTEDRWPKASRTAAMVGCRVGNDFGGSCEWPYDAGMTGASLSVRAAVPLPMRVRRFRVWSVELVGWFIHRVYMEVAVFGWRFLVRRVCLQRANSASPRRTAAANGEEVGAGGLRVVVGERIRRVFAIWEDE